MQNVSRQVEMRGVKQRPSPADGFYAHVATQAEAKSQRQRERSADLRHEAMGRNAQLDRAEAWWVAIFMPEFLAAQRDLQERAILLYEAHRSGRRQPSAITLERVIMLRANRSSHAYRIAVEDGKISLRQLKGGKAVAVEGFYTSVDLGKSSPGHVRLMLTKMIEECLA